MRKPCSFGGFSIVKCRFTILRFVICDVRCAIADFPVSRGTSSYPPCRPPHNSERTTFLEYNSKSRSSTRAYINSSASHRLLQTSLGLDHCHSLPLRKWPQKSSSLPAPPLASAGSTPNTASTKATTSSLPPATPTSSPSRTPQTPTTSH